MTVVQYGTALLHELASYIVDKTQHNPPFFYNNILQLYHCSDIDIGSEIEHHVGTQTGECSYLNSIVLRT